MFHNEASVGGVPVARPSDLGSGDRPGMWPALLAKGRRLSRDFWRGGFPGLVGMASRGIGLAVHYPAHRRWMRIVGGQTTEKLLTLYPRIAYRHSTTYLFEGASWRHRLAMLETHYTFVNAMYGPDFFNAVIEPNGFPVWTHQSGDDRFSIALEGPCFVSKHREGEFSLAFAMNGTALYKIAFSLVSDATSGLGVRPTPVGAPGTLLFLGQVQGMGGGNLEMLRDAAKGCGGIAPRDLLMSAVTGVATAWGIDRLLGVSEARQLSGRSPAQAARGFDYNAFWMQHDAVLNDEGHYLMQLPFHEGPIQASSSAHRRRTRVKRQFKADLSEAVAAVMRQNQRPGTALPATPRASPSA